jgi:hypothetical protein
MADKDTKGNLKEGNAHDQADKEPAPAPAPAPAAAVTAGSDKEKADAAKQGHQAVLTQNNQQASPGAEAVSGVGAVDPLKMRNYKEQEKGTVAVQVTSPNFYVNGSGPYQEGDTLYLSEDQVKGSANHVKKQ